MSENLPHNDHLENYLLGKLNAADKAAMDAKIAADNLLKEDMLFQRDILQALQEERRLELKNRLNNIEVGGAGSGGFTAALGYKIAAGIALIGLIGTGVYFYLNNKTVEEDNLPVGLIELPLNSDALASALPAKPEAMPELTEQTAALPEEAAPAAQLPTTAAITTVIAAESARANASTLNRPAAKLNSKPEMAKADSQPNIQVQKPKVLSDFKDTDLGTSTQPTETPVDAMARNRQFSTKSIEVTAQQHAKYDFHYQFSDNKLFIYGDFKNKPYEILEINNDGTTSYYLFFENNYYGLKSDQQKLTRLRKLSNDKLIKELEITRTQKINTQHY